ncbi:PREDICTED: regucalcin-like, partial [Rhagoletis zephyria]|uniref:regucalcin-like n=1 Tax=Rhagoletis zephyria TaxID=28612 RepID=UPI00081174E9
RHHKINLGDLVTIVIPVEGKRDQYLVSLRNKVIHLTWNLTDGTHSHKVLAEVASERRGKERFNDGKVDALGRLWIGTLLNAEDGSVVPGAGSLYKLDTANGSFTKMSSNFTLSNGMAWNANNTLMYFNDSEDRKTYVFDFDLPNGTISNKRILVDYAKEPENVYGAGEYPDGMAMDAEGRLWIALYGGGRVIRLEPSTGQLLTSVPVPAPQTTSLAFGGGAHFETIFVTTASSDVKGKPQLEAKYPQAGRIFTITRKANGTALQGVKAFNFKAKN